MSGSNSTHNTFFLKLGSWSVRFRWSVLLSSVLILGLMFALISTRLTFDTSLDSFAEQGSTAQRTLDEYRDEFGRDGLYVVVVEGNVFTPEFLSRLRALHREVLGLTLDLPSLTNIAPKDAEPSKAEVDSTREQGFTFEDDEDEEGFDTENSFAAEAGGVTAVANFSVGNVALEVNSLINARRTYRDGTGTLVVGKLTEPWPSDESDLAKMRSSAMADRTLLGRIIGQAGRHTILALKTPVVSERDSAAIYDAMVSIARKHRSDGFQPLVGGTPALNASLNSLLLSDLAKMFTLSVVIMFIVLVYLFRHPIAVIGPLYVVFFSAVSTAGTLALLEIPLTMMSNILPAFLFCVGIGHSVHLVSVYRDLRGEKNVPSGTAAEELVTEALATTGVPIFFTSVTTMVGLLSFGFASIQAIQEMGYAGAYAVGIAFLASVTILPALLSFHRRGSMGIRKQRHRDFIDRFLDFCRAASGVLDDNGRGEEPSVGRTRRRRMLVINSVLAITMVWSATQLRVWHNPLSWIPEEESIRRAFDAMDKHVGGTANVQLLIRGKQGDGLGTGMRDLDTLQALEQIETDIKAYEHPIEGNIMGTSVSVLDVVKESNRALNSGTDRDYVLPKDDRGVADMLFMFENAGPQEIAQLASRDLNTSQMTVQIRWLEASQFRQLTPYIDRSIAKHVPEGVEIKPTGAVYTLVSTIGNLIWDLLSSFGIAFVVITLLMMVLLKGLKIGLIAMVPNLMPVVVIMGVMHLSGIPIDMNNILIASISIGLAVDDTIHLLHHFRVNHLATGNVEESIRRAMAHSGRAMVSTTLILMLGFFVYMGAEMANIQRFGLLIGLTALFALLIDLFFAPALLRTFYRRQEPLKEET